MSSLKNQTVNGIKWLVGSSFLQKGIQLAGTIVLARILGPAEFGLFALAFVAIDALGLFKSMGFDTALIQRKDEVEKAANTAFFVIPLLGILLYLILAFSAPWMGKFLNNAQVVGVIRALGIIFVISCLGRVPAALLEKNMQFKQVSIIEIGTAVIFSVSAVILALLKLEVWSLVYAYILKTIYQNTLTFIYARWRPRLEFDKKIAKEMFHFGKYLFLGGLVWFLKMNLDNILVGKLLGVTALGLYAIAFNIANFGADYFGGKVSRVIFPAYSRLQSELPDLKNAALKVIKHTSLIALPLGIGIFLLGNDFIDLVYGPKWLGAINALKILTIAGVFNTLVTSIGGIFAALGKPKLGLFVILFEVTIFLIFIYPMAKLFDISGVAIVVSAASVITFFLVLHYVMRLLDISLKEIYLSLNASLISSLLMSMGIILLKKIFWLNNIKLLNINFFILFIISITIYLYSLNKIDRLILKELKELV